MNTQNDTQILVAQFVTPSSTTYWLHAPKAWVRITKRIFLAHLEEGATEVQFQPIARLKGALPTPLAQLEAEVQAEIDAIEEKRTSAAAKDEERRAKKREAARRRRAEKKAAKESGPSEGLGVLRAHGLSVLDNLAA